MVSRGHLPARGRHRLVNRIIYIPPANKKSCPSGFAGTGIKIPAVPPGLACSKTHPLTHTHDMPAFVHGEPCSGAHTPPPPGGVSGCPRKSIRFRAFRRPSSAGGSLEKRGRNVLTLPQRFSALYHPPPDLSTGIFPPGAGPEAGAGRCARQFILRRNQCPPPAPAGPAPP